MNAGRVIALALLAALGRPAAAHELRPGYLELRETEPDVFAMLWKVPARGDRRFGIRPVLPPHCAPVAPPAGTFTADAYVERGAVRCAGGLEGHPLAIDGLAATLTDVLVRLDRLDGASQTHRLTPGTPSLIVPPAPPPLAVAWTYLRLGVEHILLGFDHLLFVLALLILVGPNRRLVGTVTAFTVAHSLTLAAATLGFVHVPAGPVEATIALSIAFVAAEIVHARRGIVGLTERKPWIVAFAFGLLHGFGFAGALAEVGLPRQAIPLALLFFNVGVEIGQLLFIAAALGSGVLVRRLGIPWPSWASGVTPYLIGGLAAYWTIERVVGLL